MTSSNGNIFRVTGPLCGKFTGHPHKGHSDAELLMFSLICDLNGWVNNREAGDSRWHRAHHDVTVMYDSTYTTMTVLHSYQCISAASCLRTVHVDWRYKPARSSRPMFAPTLGGRAGDPVRTKPTVDILPKRFSWCRRPSLEQLRR